MPEHLFVHLSTNKLCFARYDAASHSAFAFSTFRLNPKISLTANLREAERTEPLIQEGNRAEVQVIVSSPATFVPLAEFQEEDCEAIYSLCLGQDKQRRVFYDVVAAANCVVLFSLKSATCHTLEETFENVHYVSSLTPLIRHFTTKGNRRAGQKRFFIYGHEQTAEILVFEDNRLLLANSYNVGNAVDVTYYTLSAAQQLGADIAPAGEESEAQAAINPEAFTPFYVAGEDNWRHDICEELQRFAVNVLPVNPGAEYNRHIISTTKGVPYDLMTLLLDYK